MTRAKYRFENASLLSSVLFGAAMIALVKLAPDLAGTPWLPVFALLPAAPLIWGMRVWWRYLQQIDELEQKIELSALAFAAATLCVLGSFLFALQLAKVIALDTIDAIAIGPVSLSLGYLLARAVIKARYR